MGLAFQLQSHFKMRKHLLFITFFIALLSGCDKIEDPFLTPPPPYGDRVIVVEDYTGHRCKNCPKAAKDLKEIEEVYGERIIGIAVHAGAGNFTNPSPPNYPTNFKTPAGNAMANFFGVSFLPVGMTSRVGYTPTGNSHLQPHGQWASTVNENIEKFAEVIIEPTVTYNSADSLVTVDVDITTTTDLAYNLKYVVLLLEDNIVAPQLMPDDTRDTTYVHHDVLREAFTQPLGDDLTTSATTTGTVITKQVAGKLKLPDWNENECEIVVYVSHADTYEILQAAKVKLIP